MRLTHVIFDLDGTLLDTLDDLHASMCYALQAHDLPPRTRDETRANVGNGVRRLVERSVPAGADTELIEQVLESFRAHYATHCEIATAPYPGIDSLLQGLEEHGIGCGIISNKPDSAVTLLARRWFAQAGDFARGERDGVARKPAPDALLQMIDEMGVSPCDVAYVGDSEVDLEFAANAGVDCIACSWGFRTEEALVGAGASRIAHNPSELLDMLIG